MTRDADQRLYELAARQYSVFTTAHARLAGFTPAQIKHRVATKQWARVHDYAYALAGVKLPWEAKVLAACWAGGFRAVGSHRSAAALWGLAGGRRNVIEITCPRWRRARHDGLFVHETKALELADLTIRRGIPTTAPERTLLDLGAACHESVVEMALDAAENRGLVTASSLRRTLERLGRPGRNGAGVLRRLLEARSGRPAVPESEMETMLLQILRRRGLPAPVPQYEIRQGGVFVARVDAAYPELRIAIEYDSVEHHASRKKLMRDNARRNRLWAAGWFPLSATVTDLKDGGSIFCAAVAEARRRAS